MGIGILRMPAVIAGYITDPYIFISLWVAGGLISLIGASIYAEMGTRFPSAGGPLVYAQKALGDQYGFITGWANWIFIAGVMAYLSIAVSEYTIKLLDVSLPTGLVSSVFIILLAILQWRGMHISSNIQKIMSLLKALALLFFVAACLINIFTHSDDSSAET